MLLVLNALFVMALAIALSPMTKFVVAVALAVAFLVVYLIWIRPYLRSLPQFAEVWRREDSLFAAVRAWLDGRKTILAGMWGTILGWGPDFLQIVSGVDLKTALSLPDNWALIVSGLLIPTLMLIFRTKAKAS